MEAKKKRGRSAAGKKRHWVKEALEDERMPIGSWIKEELEDGNEELKEGIVDIEEAEESKRERERVRWKEQRQENGAKWWRNWK